MREKSPTPYIRNTASLLSRGYTNQSDRRPATFLPNVKAYGYERPGFGYYERVSSFAQTIAAGDMPNLGNGFRFELDSRPAGHEDEHISAQEYTAYFSRGIIPIAAPGHALHSHDCGHGPNFQTLFANSMFAGVVRDSASKALASDQSEKFTKAMDGFGDMMLLLEAAISDIDPRLNSIGLPLVVAAEQHLMTLVDLHAENSDQQQSTYDSLHTELGLDEHRQREVDVWRRRA